MVVLETKESEMEMEVQTKSNGKDGWEITKSHRGFFVRHNGKVVCHCDRLRGAREYVQAWIAREELRGSHQ
jgi:hypothetical protein